MRRISVVVAIAVILSGAAAALQPTPARACSCVGLMVRDAVREAEGALVGTVIGRKDPVGGAIFGGGSTEFTIDVEVAITGELGDEVVVVSPSSGGTCGLGVGVGQRVGLLLYVTKRGAWSSSLCSTVDPDELIAATQPLPAPDGTGPIRAVIGGNFGEARLIAIDDRGRTLAYGWGEGTTYAVAMCPGGRLLVEAFTRGASASVAVREVASLRVLRTVRVAGGRFPAIYHVGCLDERAASIVAIEGGDRDIRVFSVEREGVRSVYEAPGSGWLASISGGVPYVEPRGGEFSAVDIETGSAGPVLPGERLPGSPSVSPDGSWVVALHTGPKDGTSTLRFSPVPGGPGFDIELSRRFRFGRFSWDPVSSRLAFAAGGALAVVDVPGARILTEIKGWGGSDVVLSGEAATGLSWDGVRFLPIPSGGVSRTWDVLDGELYALAAAEPGVEAEPGEDPRRPTIGPGASPSPSPTGTAGGWWIVGSVLLALAVVATVARRARRRVDGPAPPPM